MEKYIRAGAGHRWQHSMVYAHCMLDT